MDLKKGKLYRVKMFLSTTPEQGEFDFAVSKGTVVMFLMKYGHGIKVLLGEQILWIDNNHFYNNELVRGFEEVTE